MKTRTILAFVLGIGLMFCAHAFPQATPCPPGASPSGKSPQSKAGSTQPLANKSAPRKNAPVQHQAGGKGNQSSSHGGGVGVGVGMNVDLGGIGQRRAEPDPFAVQQKVPTSEETKTSSIEPKTRSHSQGQPGRDVLWSRINPVKKDIGEPSTAE